MNDRYPAFSIIYNIFAIPYNFFMGFVVGLLAPVAAIAAVVAGVRLLTGKVPFVSLAQDEGEEERHLALELVAPDRVGDLFAVERKKVEDELAGLQDEIRTIIEESRAKAQEAEEATAEA
jgi:hypothetical protein